VDAAWRHQSSQHNVGKRKSKSRRRITLGVGTSNGAAQVETAGRTAPLYKKTDERTAANSLFTVGGDAAVVVVAAAAFHTDSSKCCVRRIEGHSV